MTTITEDWAPVDLLAHDPMPLPQDHRAQVCWAIRAAARVNGGIVHAGTWREYLPETINPHLIGAVVRSLRESGAIKWTGQFAASGNGKSRNARKPVLEWRVVDMGGVR